MFSDAPPGLGSKRRLPGVSLRSTPGHLPAALRAAEINKLQSAIGLRAKPALCLMLRARFRVAVDRSTLAPCVHPIYKATRLNRRALPMTDSELNVIAAAAMMGLSRIPKKG